MYAGISLGRLTVNSQMAHLSLDSRLFVLNGHMSSGEDIGCLDKGGFVPFMSAITARRAKLPLD